MSDSRDFAALLQIPIPTSTLLGDRSIGPNQRSTTESRSTEAGLPVRKGPEDHRDDLPQVVIAIAVTRDGIPVRCWTFPGSESDQRIIRTVKDDLGQVNCAAGLGWPKPAIASALDRLAD